jgi:hypothetical protein
MRIGTRWFIGAMAMSITAHRFIAATDMRPPSRRRAVVRSTRDDARANTGSSSLSVTDMYNMLAHSAVLDDNSGMSRQPVDVAPREAAALPSSRSSASDASSWNSDLSQRRVTDTPSQFSK